jgi:hypothetical protein
VVKLHITDVVNVLWETSMSVRLDEIGFSAFSDLVYRIYSVNGEATHPGRSVYPKLVLRRTKASSSVKFYRMMLDGYTYFVS